MYFYSKLNAIALGFFIAFTFTNSALSIESDNQSPESWPDTQTVLVGACVGGASGILSRITDHIWPFNWVLLSELQKTVLQAIVTDARKENFPTNSRLLCYTAWIASWISWAAAANTLEMESGVEQPTVWAIIR